MPSDIRAITGRNRRQRSPVAISPYSTRSPWRARNSMLSTDARVMPIRAAIWS